MLGVKTPSLKKGKGVFCRKGFYTISHFKRRPFGSASLNVIWQLLLYNRLISFYQPRNRHPSGSDFRLYKSAIERLKGVKQVPKSKKLTKNEKEDRKLMMKIMRKERKRMFGENTNVLDKDSFYKNMDYLGTVLGKSKGKLTKKKLMKIGAISGCYEMNDPHNFK